MRNPWKFKSWSSACRMPFSLTTIKTLIFNSSLVTCLSMLFFEFILFKLHSAWFCTFLPFTQFGFGYYFFTFFFFWSQFLSSPSRTPFHMSDLFILSPRHLNFSSHCFSIYFALLFSNWVISTDQSSVLPLSSAFFYRTHSERYLFQILNFQF